MKKTIALLLGVATIIGTSIPALAVDINKGEPISNINGEPVVISTNVPKDTINNNLIIAGKKVSIGNLGVVIKNKNVMVPLKITAESLGFKVHIDKDNKVVSLDNNKIKTKMVVGVDSYYYSSSHLIGCIAPRSLGVAPTIIDNVVYVPIKVYNLLFNNPNAVGSFWCKTKEGQLIYVDKGDGTTFLSENSKMIGMPNPIKEFKTLEEAQNSLKFKIVLPKEIPSEFKVKIISTISKDIFQIRYSNGKNDILFRMGQGIDKIDGDYNEYKFNDTVAVDGKNVNLSGNNNLINLATWKVNEMSYSISVANGMEKDNILKIIKSTL